MTSPTGSGTSSTLHEIGGSTDDTIGWQGRRDHRRQQRYRAGYRAAVPCIAHARPRCNAAAMTVSSSMVRVRMSCRLN
jgi:hypothetical protein